MTRYATTSDDKSHPVLVWDDASGTHKVVGRHASLDDLADEVAGGMDVHRFTVPLTTDMRSPANRGNHPMVDGDGAPLWVGARVAFVQADRWGQVTINDGAEVMVVGEHGDVYVDCDRAHAVRDRNQTQVDMRRRQTFTGCYRQDGPLKGHTVLSAERGDRYESGTHRASVTLAESPLRVCEHVPEPFPARSPSP